MLEGRLYHSLSDLYWGAYGVSRWLVERGPGASLRLLVHEEAPAIARFRMPLRRRLWLWRYGFLSQADVLYGEDGITADNHHRYLSSYQRDQTQRINGRWGEALENILLFHHLLDGFPERRSTIHAHLMDGRYTPVDARETASDDDAADRVMALLDEHHRLVLKPTYGTIGKRILMYESIEDGYRVNGEHHSGEEFAARIPDLDDYLVAEFVEQAPYASALYPDSPNTFRVLMMIDPDSGEPFVAAAAHRIGTDRSAPLDNWSRGGLSADVGASGDLGEAVQYPYDGHRERHTSHPDTGAPIAGVAIPGWPAIRRAFSTSQRAVRRFPTWAGTSWSRARVSSRSSRGTTARGYASFRSISRCSTIPAFGGSTSTMTCFECESLGAPNRWLNPPDRIHSRYCPTRGRPAFIGSEFAIAAVRSETIQTRHHGPFQ